MQACLKSRAKMGHRVSEWGGGLESAGFLRDMQVSGSGNSDDLHCQALFRCVTSPHLCVRPGDVYRSGPAASNPRGT